MPKITLPSLPLSALFAVSKPSGPTSMSIIEDIKALASASRLFVDEESARANAEVVYGGGKVRRPKKGRGKKNAKTRGKGFEVKIGQGGTLDPLADGVLVIGIGKATKKLSTFLDCTKEYRTTCLLGSETDSYDSEGSIMRHAPWTHVTPDAIRSSLSQFRGEIQQTPPIFSALKMDGRPLYEYARAGIPLPRPIQPRSVTVHGLEMLGFETEQGFRPPKKVFSEEEREKLRKCLKGTRVEAVGVSEGKKLEEDSKVGGNVQGSSTTTTATTDGAAAAVAAGGHVLEAPTEDVIEEGTPPAFTLEMCVSGGTYVRSLVHDVGHAVGSAAHVVTLTRTRQGRFRLDSAQGASTVVDGDRAIGASTEGETSAGTSSQETETETETGLPFRPCVPWEVFERALGGASKRLGHKPGVHASAQAHAQSSADSVVVDEVVPDAVADSGVQAPVAEDAKEEEVDEDGWRPWERAVMEAMEVVEDKNQK